MQAAGNIIIVTHFTPAAAGNGGQHRSYQILWDCTRAVGEENVVVLSWDSWLSSLSRTDKASVLAECLAGIRSLPGGRRFLRFLRRLSNSFVRARYNIWQLISPTYYSPVMYSNPRFLAAYREKIRHLGIPLVCIVEHSGFSDIVRLNSDAGIPTISCLHNLESLDGAGRLDFKQRLNTRSRIADLHAELSVLRQCADRLFISKVEAAMINSIGLNSVYYSYRPVGAIADRLNRVRRQRYTNASTKQTPGRFVMLGSAVHKPTGDGFRWFVEQATCHGLPSGVSVEVIGAGTEQLTQLCPTSSQIHCLGWVGQSELEERLIGTRGVLLPQAYGFGSLTRLVELPTAGIPVIVSEWMTYATDILPGVRIVSDSWEAWDAAIRELEERGSSVLGPEPRPEASDSGNALQANLRRHLEAG